MRVAWITTGFSAHEDEYNGAAAIHNLARELASHKDIELTIFSLYYPVNKPEYTFYGAKVFSFAQEDNIIKTGKLSIWRRCIKKFGEEHNENRFDVLHSMWAGESGFVSSRLSKKFNIPLAVSICGGELAYYPEISYGSRTKILQKRFVNSAFKGAKVIISGSDFITELVKKYYPDKILKKTVKIPFGIDETLFKPYERTNKGNHPLTLVNIANVSLVKDHVTLLKSILKVREKFPGVTLLHYGKDEKNILVNMVRDLGLENNVRIDGFLDYKHIADTLRKADIYVLSSLYESQNMSIIEAALCGLPVVSTNAGAAKEITDNIVKFGDSTALADMIIKTSENLEIEKRKAVSNIDLLKVNYSLKSSSEKFVELYRSLTGS